MNSLIVAEILTFSITAFSLGFGFMPKFSRASFFVILCWLTFPAVMASSLALISEPKSLVFSGNFSGLSKGFFSGALAGFMVSASAWASIIFAGWVNAVVFPKDIKETILLRGDDCRTSLFTFLGLLFCFSFFQSDAGTSIVVAMFDLLESSKGQDHQLFFNQGMSVIFYLSILLSFPIFLASLVVDILIFFLERLAGLAVGEGIFGAFRLPVILLCLAVFVQLALQGFVSDGFHILDFT